MRRFQPLFLLFLIAGPFVLLPYLVLSPAIVTLRAAWKRKPKLLWRSAILVSVSTAFLVTLPASPLFCRLDAPFPVTSQTDPVSIMVQGQVVLVNAAVIALVVVFPISAAHTVCTLMDRRKLKTIDN